MKATIEYHPCGCSVGPSDEPTFCKKHKDVAVLVRALLKCREVLECVACCFGFLQSPGIEHGIGYFGP